ncbi:prolyl oligopeptidase family serine peptidase [Luteococcus peritonei]|uniref:prolyl oligopeptidase n=1 Tax=Luteococcus peritonei TaxID=88874 RepID=A0ABW4RU96_9ACTN
MTTYPETRRDDLVEDLHGHQVPDPYRWLEDPDSVETRDWVERQRAFTEQHLAGLPERAWFQRELRELVSRPRVLSPVHESGWWLVARSDGVQPQPVWYAARSLDELATGGRVVMDPNTWTDDGSASLNGFSVSPDGRLLAYCRSDGGSDWQKVRVVELESGEEVNDPGVVTKFSLPQWLPDSRSFLYSRYAEVGRAEGTQTDALPAADLVVHRLGQQQSEDEVLWANPGEAMLFTGGHVSHDQRWLVVVQGWGTERANSIWLHSLTLQGAGDQARTVVGERVELVPERTDLVWPIRVDGDEVVCQTTREAPLGRVVRMRAGSPDEMTTLVPEGSDPIESVTPAGDGFVLTRLVDCAPRYTRHALDGTELGEVEVPGAADLGVTGEAGVDDVVVATSSVSEPTITTRLRFATGQAERIDLLAREASGAPVQAQTLRRRATSADGTQVPYWLILPEGADPDQPRPTIVYGYGGFNVTILPWYGHGWAAWLKAGGAVAIANLRGGAEFGQAWYDAGRREHKQNVFDDVIAVGEDLLATGAARPGQLVVHGASNGGLLVGAAMTQRPDLWTVALPSVGVLDMLRFHRFTGGLAWASDYGNPDEAADFEVALAYSPLHNVREGTAYPATLVTTGDHDDRVVPLHSHKFAAALQHAQAGEAPVLTRIETATGHGAGKPLAKVADEWADRLAFAAHHTGLVPSA